MQASSGLRRHVVLAGVGLVAAGLLCASGRSAAGPAIETYAALFREQVDRRLEIPAEDQQLYARLASEALEADGISGLAPQFVAVIDRDPNTQAFMLLWATPDNGFRLVGAAPASTGKPGRYEYFESPLGVFRHSLGALDFRALGTRNDNGILGYGPKGTRVYDFGWQAARRGWGAGGISLMRLQMHSTDPDLLEPRVGSVQSKGCIRIPLSVNRFIDRYGLLDADYDRALAQGMNLWMLQADREPAPGAGRYLIVVDSQRQERPAWSPHPVAWSPRAPGAPGKAPTDAQARRGGIATSFVATSH